MNTKSPNPKDLHKEPTLLPIEIFSSSGESAPARVSVHYWNRKERRNRAIGKILKLLRYLLIPICIAPFVHPLILPTAATLISSPIWILFLYLYWSGQKATFLFAEGKCPYCSKSGHLNRYLWNTLAEEITLICPECGQTCRGLIPGLRSPDQDSKEE